MLKIITLMDYIIISRFPGTDVFDGNRQYCLCYSNFAPSETLPIFAFLSFRKCTFLNTVFIVAL